MKRGVPSVVWSMALGVGVAWLRGRGVVAWRGGGASWGFGGLGGRGGVPQLLAEDLGYVGLG